MKRALILIGFYVICLSAIGQINSELSDALQSYLNQAVEIEGNNGVSAYLITANGEIWSGTSGLDGQGQSITSSTVFHGASTTKFNMALLFILLNEEGLVNLDAPWAEYVSLNVSFSEAITVRQLLNHSSGIADYLETGSTSALILSDFEAFYSPEYILEEIVNPEPLFTAGTGFQYSNSNYVLLGLIAESITGNSVQEELRNRIWEPLGMEHTYFGGYENYSEPSAGVWWNFGNGVSNYSDESSDAMLSLAYSAGNIVTCPRDLAVLLHAVMEQELITEESWVEMQAFVPQSFSSWTQGYGLGIHHLNTGTEDMVIGHDGYHTNLTDMFHSTDYGFTLVTMTNTQTQWLSIYNSLYDILSAHFSTNDLEENKGVKISVYPNPSAHEISFRSDQIIDLIEVSDMMGKTIHKISPSAQEASITIYENGAYIITISSGGKLIRKKHLIR